MKRFGLLAAAVAFALANVTPTFGQTPNPMQIPQAPAAPPMTKLPGLICVYKNALFSPGARLCFGNNVAQTCSEKGHWIDLHDTQNKDACKNAIAP